MSTCQQQECVYASTQAQGASLMQQPDVGASPPAAAAARGRPGCPGWPTSKLKMRFLLSSVRAASSSKTESTSAGKQGAGSRVLQCERHCALRCLGLLY